MTKTKRKAASRRRRKGAPRRSVVGDRPNYLFEVLRAHVGQRVAAVGKDKAHYEGILRQVMHDGVLIELADGLLYMGHADIELAIGVGGSAPAQGEPVTSGIVPEEDF